VKSPILLTRYIKRHISEERRPQLHRCESRKFASCGHFCLFVVFVTGRAHQDRLLLLAYESKFVIYTWTSQRKHYTKSRNTKLNWHVAVFKCNECLENCSICQLLLSVCLSLYIHSGDALFFCISAGLLLSEAVDECLVWRSFWWMTQVSFPCFPSVCESNVLDECLVWGHFDEWRMFLSHVFLLFLKGIC